MDRRVYLRVCKRLLTEQQRRRKKIKFFFFGMYQTPASKQRKKKTKRLRKLQQKQKIKIKTLCPSRSVYVISFSVYVCAFIYSNFFLLFCNKKKKLVKWMDVANLKWSHLFFLCRRRRRIVPYTK